MGARPGDEEDSSVTELPEFLNTNLDRNQVADKIAEYFTTISKEFKPVNVETLPKEVKEAIEMAVPDQVPVIHPEEVGALLRTITTNKSMTKDDIYPILYRAGSDILKYPVTDLFNKIARTGKWPKRWNTDNSFIRKKSQTHKHWMISELYQRAPLSAISSRNL